jgi:hypothetical protein
MPRVQGPCLSLAAHGQLGKGLIFQKTVSGFKAYKYNEPGSVKKYIPSDPQIMRRELYREVIGKWRDLNNGQRGEYNVIADKQISPMSGWNYFYKLHYEEWANEDKTKYGNYGIRIYGWNYYGFDET